jgi:hypothetical protein
MRGDSGSFDVSLGPPYFVTAYQHVEIGKAHPFLWSVGQSPRE